MSTLTAEITESALALSRKFLEFVNGAVTPFHAVSIVSNSITAAGFHKLDERQSWGLKPGGRYFITRNGTSIIFFVVGKGYVPGNGIKIIGAHTDSPNLQLKPAAATPIRRSGMLGARVQCYGGGLWHTWFDRDLGAAGRLMVKDPNGSPFAVRSQLVCVTAPILRVPTLAIHLRTAAERESFAPNAETHVVPILGSEEALKKSLGDSASIVSVMAKAAGVDEASIVDFDISIVDTQPASIGGALSEFIHSPRIDNLLSCFAATEALLGALDAAEADSAVTMVALFDNEEVGSATYQGAESSFVGDIMSRLVSDASLKPIVAARSFLLSVDGAHAVNPNYSEKHEDAHAPLMNRGPVLKYNVNARYSTNGQTAAIIHRLASAAGVPVQRYAVKNDSPCGSTIGPILTTLLGVQGADIGNPMWSMHSIRETAGVVDLLYLTKLIDSFIKNYSSVTVDA